MLAGCHATVPARPIGRTRAVAPIALEGTSTSAPSQPTGANGASTQPNAVNRGSSKANADQPPALEDTSRKSASLETAAYTDSDHVTVMTPSVSATIENALDGATLSGTYLLDVVSAASVDIVATASRRWKEARHAGALSGQYKPHALGVGFSSSVSSEPDYLSYGAAGHLSYDVNEKNTALFFGYGYGHDTSGRSHTPFTVFARTLQRGSFVGGLDQIIDESTTASLALSVIIENGDQSKPYRYIPLFAPNVAPTIDKGASIDIVNARRVFERPLEQLPLSRRRFAFTSGIAHRFDASTIRATERVYVDNWGLKASTTDARWFFDAGSRVRIWPHLRFHAQTPVVFWQRAYVSAEPVGWSLPVYRTGDRELGPLWTADGGGGIKVYLGGAEHPRMFSIGAEMDGIYTSYLDDLYITQRTGFLGTLTFSIEEEP